MTRGPERIFQVYGLPACFGSDNGPAFVPTAVHSRQKDKHLDTHTITALPGRTPAAKASIGFLEPLAVTGGYSAHRRRRSR